MTGPLWPFLLYAAGGIGLALLVLLLLWFGIYPSPLINTTRTAAVTLAGRVPPPGS
jgi:NADH:ubiquinone oxidoreductase subunit 4 (subunit M)